MDGKKYCQEKIKTVPYLCSERDRRCVVRSDENCPGCKYSYTIESCCGGGASSTWTTEVVGAGRIR